MFRDGILFDNVENFVTFNNFFEFLYSTGTHFLTELKNLRIHYLSKENNLKDFCLFQGNSLEKLELINKKDLDKLEKCSIEVFSKMKNLKSFKLDGCGIKGADPDFNYLEEAEFSSEIPENLTNLEELRLCQVFDTIDSDVEYIFTNLFK